jgi:four helix bundle protein
MASFTELEVWKQARHIRILVKELTNSFPPDEKYRLGDQIIRCSRSIGNNLAEGHGRFHYQDNIRFCIIARGSLSETLDHLIVACDDKIISKEKLQEMELELDKCMRMLNGYIAHLKTKKAVTN